MIVYVYADKTNAKIDTIKGATKIESRRGEFWITAEGELYVVPKEGIKIVVYGF